MKQVVDPVHGFAGKLARIFVQSKLTPLFVVTSILLGIWAIYSTPREEEPQIIVPMIDVHIPFPGASAREVEERITTPLEKLLWGLPDVDYIYSTSQNGGALVTVRFYVGTALESAVIRVHHKIREHMPEKPQGVGMPLVRSYTIDDVPFLAITLHSPKVSDYELRTTAQHFSHALSEIPDVSRVQIIGGEPRQVRIVPDPKKLALYHVSLLEYFPPLLTSNVEGVVGHTKGNNPEWIVEVGGFFTSTQDIQDIVVGIKGGRPVRLQDIARVLDGPAERTQQVFHVTKNHKPEQAVTLSFAKRPGTNATLLAQKVLQKVETLKISLLPQDTEISITRNYGETAKEKSNTLIEHLLIATFSVMILIALTLGVRSSFIIGAAVPVTLALTLLIYYILGYTLNRVTLFALIFSIGILVDDAIVVVENIHRHMHTKALRKGKSLTNIIVAAVNEVGNPTILATFTVIAAILPMAFVGGLMGPYMRPIPIGASVAMMFSLIVAFTVSPWAARKTHVKEYHRLNTHFQEADSSEKHQRAFLDQVYDWVMGRLLDKKKAQFVFVTFIVMAFLSIGGLMYWKYVRVKMLPFDNKSEFQIVVDMEEGTTLEKTQEAAFTIANELKDVDEVDHYQIYVGNSAPVNFNGLVRHYFLRSQSNFADIQVNLKNKHERDRQSHVIAQFVRQRIQEPAKKFGARVKVVEIPPGPPVLSTLVTEVYGPTHDKQIEVSKQVLKLYEETPGVVDIDWSVPAFQNKYLVRVNRRNASLQRVPVDRVFQTANAAFGGTSLGLIHDEKHPEPITIWLQLSDQNRQDLEALMNLQVMSDDGSFVPFTKLARVEKTKTQLDIFHKNLQRVVYVMGDLAGQEESPVYAMFNLNRKFENLKDDQGNKIPILLTHQPAVTDHLSLKWDGEWQITYEVFRDLGIAFAIVLLLIYLLVVGWFESFFVPLIIMLPIPLSLIGIIPGHWIFGAFFTATSMIGFIAGAGIIVRNSIILVDFIELGLRNGESLREAVLKAGEVRFRPMLLTAAAVVVGSGVILFDPIFQGLAISLMMGEVAATLLSRFAVPVLYYVMVGKRREQLLSPESS